METLIKEKCLACGTKDDLSIDHIRPKKLGGSDERQNLQVLCRTCNTMKRQEIIDFSKGIPKWFAYRLTLKCPICNRRFNRVSINQVGVCLLGHRTPLKTKKQALPVDPSEPLKETL